MASDSPPAGPPAKPALSSTALSLADAAALLSKVSGEPITIEMLKADVRPVRRPMPTAL
ncbi:MAG: hypothetical protein HY290_03975 [Planctomycetia bacterium]|nr:hypothetical protein [Planctomycetia bacterium]